MQKRLITESFWCTVEGKREMSYFHWLQKLINSTNARKANIKINMPAEKISPDIYVKGLNILEKTDLYHVIDTETQSIYHVKSFKSQIDKMREAEKHKDIKYHLAYSNMSFEVWMLLHKTSNVPYVIEPKYYLNTINRIFQTQFQSIKDFKEETNFNRILSSLNLQDVKKAVENAANLMNNVSQKQTPEIYRKEKYYCDNPSLSVHEFVKRILCAAGL